MHAYGVVGRDSTSAPYTGQKKTGPFEEAAPRMSCEPEVPEGFGFGFDEKETGQAEEVNMWKVLGDWCSSRGVRVGARCVRRAETDGLC